MSARRSLSMPILLAIVMIALLIVLAVGWVISTVVGALQDADSSGWYWTLLSIGSTFILLLIVGVVLYLILSIKAINLTRRQSNFIDSVTHELKSPLASMKLYLQTLNRHQVAHEVQADFHRFMLEDLERLDHLINQMLAAARLDADRVSGDVEDVEVSALLAECAAAVCLNYRVSPEVVQLELQPCVVAARRVDLDIIYRNLIDNAVKYAGAPPQVKIQLRADAHGQVITRVGDNGRGIPYHLRRKIFGRFVRLGSELERDKPGTGLGLHLAASLTRRYRGRIRIRDPERRPGIVFEVVLPGRPAPREEDQKTSVEAAKPVE